MHLFKYGYVKSYITHTDIYLDTSMHKADAARLPVTANKIIVQLPVKLHLPSVKKKKKKTLMNSADTFALGICQ